MDDTHAAQEGDPAQTGCGGAYGAARRGTLCLLLAALGFCRTVGLMAEGTNLVINPPIGPYVNLSPSAFSNAVSYTSRDRLVATPYFYWYDVYSGAHLRDPDGSDALTDHPPTLTGFSYRSAAWHREQLLDMIAAGIDILLPVYWGEPSQRIPGQPVSAQPWSYAGIPPLVEARESLLAEGEHPPRIGLFYDTSTLQYNAADERIDLTTARGQQWFYETVRDFFSLIPPGHWALIDGRPIVFLYSSGFAAQHDQGCIEFLRTNFAREFGERVPFIVREISWNVRSEQVYAWGGALGLRNPGVASLGPGYDHSAVPGREPLVVPREDGRFFERNWESLLSRPPHLVMIETWNEYHEGTDIAASREYGRTYLALNRQYADRFRSGEIRAGPFTGARRVEIRLGGTNLEAGLVQFELPDGLTAATNLSGMDCRVFLPTSHAGRYVYFRVDNSFKWADTMEAQLVAEYFDASPGTLRLEFDGSDSQAPFQGAYTASPETVALAGSRTWRRAVFSLSQARLLGSQNGGADFRITSTAPGCALHEVQLLRPGLRAEGMAPDGSFRLTLYAAPGPTYAVEHTRNLVDWKEWLTVRPAQTAITLTDPEGAAYPHRLYRARPR